MNLRRGGRAGGGRRPPPARRPRMSIDIIPFVLASFGERSAFRGEGRASGGAASPGLGGQRTPRGKGKGKDMGITTYGLTRHSWRATSWEKVPYFFPKN